MSNDVADQTPPVDEQPKDPPAPLVILATDPDTVCIDDLCVPPEARE